MADSMYTDDSSLNSAVRNAWEEGFVAVDSELVAVNKRLAKIEARARFQSMMSFWSTRSLENGVSEFIHEQGFGAWYARDAWNHVRSWEWSPPHDEVFEYLWARFGRG